MMAVEFAARNSIYGGNPQLLSLVRRFRHHFLFREAHVELASDSGNHGRPVKLKTAAMEDTMVDRGAGQGSLLAVKVQFLGMAEATMREHAVCYLGRTAELGVQGRGKDAVSDGCAARKETKGEKKQRKKHFPSKFKLINIALSRYECA
jgi:hypothetical protein